MKVKDLMTSEVTSCDLNASLADAAKAMWDHDCGVLPVLKDGKELVGVITDRDICMASAMRDSNPSQISVEESITGEVFSTTPDTDLQKALDTMGQHQVHRLPVVDSQGQLIGILSMNNVTQCFDRKGMDLTPKKIVEAFKSIGTQRQLPEKNEQAISATV